MGALKFKDLLTGQWVYVARGPKGVKGDKGDKGDTGPAGPQGPKGDKGDMGPQGPAGAGTGDMLASTYDPAGGVRQVAFADELAAMELTPGPEGPQGEQGPQGIQGPKGDKGDQGDVGPQGLKGDDGADGAQGPEGLQGIQGPKGDKGDKGDKGEPGDPATNLVQSVNGQTGVVTVGDVTTAQLTSGLDSKANTSHSHPISDITATGTRSSSTYLRGDGTFATPPNTTYTEITSAEITAGTASTARAISGRRAQEIVNKAVAAAPVVTVNATAPASPKVGDIWVEV